MCPEFWVHITYVGVFMYSLAGWSCNGEIGLGTWVGLCHSLREKYNSRGYIFLMFTGISAENLSLYPCGTIPHIISNYPRAHYNAGLNTSAAVCRRRYLVSVRNLSIRCACNQTKVCRRKCSGRRLPALYITSANSAFAAFFKSSGFRVSWTPILPPLTTILSRDAAPASIRVTYCFFMPMAVQPPRT